MDILNNIDIMILLSIVLFLGTTKILGMSVKNIFSFLKPLPDIFTGFLAFSLVSGPIVIVLNMLHIDGSTFGMAFQIAFWAITLLLVFIAKKNKFDFGHNMYYPIMLVAILVVSVVHNVLVPDTSIIADHANAAFSQILLAANDGGSMAWELSWGSVTTDTINVVANPFYQAGGLFLGLFKDTVVAADVQLFMLVASSAFILSALSKLLDLFVHKYQLILYIFIAAIVGFSGTYGGGLVIEGFLPLVIMMFGIMFIRNQLVFSHVSWMSLGLYFWMSNPFFLYLFFFFIFILRKQKFDLFAVAPIIVLNIIDLWFNIGLKQMSNVDTSYTASIIINITMILTMIIAIISFDRFLFTRKIKRSFLNFVYGVIDKHKEIYLVLMVLPLGYVVYDYVKVIMDDGIDIQGQIIYLLRIIEIIVIISAISFAIAKHRFITDAKRWIFVSIIFVNPLWLLVGDAIYNGTINVPTLQTLLLIDTNLGMFAGAPILFLIIVILLSVGSHKSILKKDAFEAQHDSAAPLTRATLVKAIKENPIKKIKDKRNEAGTWNVYRDTR